MIRYREVRNNKILMAWTVHWQGDGGYTGKPGKIGIPGSEVNIKLLLIGWINKLWEQKKAPAWNSQIWKCVQI